jgi:type II secretory pathway component PulF
MGEWPQAFGQADVAMVRSGRETGPLPEALVLLADHRETTGGMTRQVASALVYPVVIAVVVGLLLTLFLAFMMPRFMDLFEELGIGRDNLPAVTLVVAWVGSHLFRTLCWLTIPVVCVIALIRLYVRSLSGRLAWDYVKLCTPVVGMVLYHAALSRVTGLLDILLCRRIPLVESLRLAAASAGNAVMGGAFRTAAERVAAGDRLSVALRETEVLPEGLPWRVAVAEQAGDLAASFRAAAASHRAQADLRLRAFVAVIEPALIICIGIIVGCVIVGCLSPLIAVVGQLSG